MLGRDVERVARGRGHDVFALTHEALDVTDSRAVDACVARRRPETVINCAAWTDVDGAEDRERDATRINNEGAALVAAAAESEGASVLYPSTDYVFDGSKRAPYVESDMPSPISAYGRSKQAGETAVAISNPRHFIVRTSWLFGCGGGNFVETMLRLGGEQPEVLVVSDQIGCPTYTSHLATALVDLVEGEAYGIHHVAAEGTCSWFEFAQEIFDQEGLETRVMSATTDMLARKARRPTYSVLRSERGDAVQLPHWREGLASYLAERRRSPAEALA